MVLRHDMDVKEMTNSMMISEKTKMCAAAVCGALMIGATALLPAGAWGEPAGASGANGAAAASSQAIVENMAREAGIELRAGELPELVNGNFQYPTIPSNKWVNADDFWVGDYGLHKRFVTINPKSGTYGQGCYAGTFTPIPGFNRSTFGWTSNQNWCEGANVEFNLDTSTGNVFAELTADEGASAVYQDVVTVPGAVYTWELKHTSATNRYVDRMQVMIGAPGHETAQRAERIASQNGNRVGEVSDTLVTRTTSDRADVKRWDTYRGAYTVPAGQTVTRFTFNAIDSPDVISGNDLDDIRFVISYPLTYNLNGGAGAEPGKEL